MDSGHLTKMSDKIFVEEQTDIPPQQIHDALELLDRAITEEWPEERLAELLRELVPTFRDPEEINRAVEAEAEDTKTAEPVPAGV